LWRGREKAARGFGRFFRGYLADQRASSNKKVACPPAENSLFFNKVEFLRRSLDSSCTCLQMTFQKKDAANNAGVIQFNTHSSSQRGALLIELDRLRGEMRRIHLRIDQITIMLRDLDEGGAERAKPSEDHQRQQPGRRR